MADPIQDVTFSQATNVTLNNYYDIIHTSVGGLNANEKLQLKLIADPVDINNDDASKGGYIWWSYYNLLTRSDTIIAPSAVDDSISATLGKVSVAYGDFLNVLIRYVAEVNLSPQDQKEVADIEKTLNSLKQDITTLMNDDFARWSQYAALRGYQIGDQTRYAQWEQQVGNSGDILDRLNQQRSLRLRRKVILNKKFPDPEDVKIRDASAAYDNILMQLGYPVRPDYRYSNGSQFSADFLSTFAGTTNAMFDSRLYITWEPDLKKILSTQAGRFSAAFNKHTGTSDSMSRDWGASGSGSYFFISASCNANEHTAIQEDFDKMTSMSLAASAVFRVDIKFGTWFDPTLFGTKHVGENPDDFIQFFGPTGSLLYIPAALILLKGFSVNFMSTQNWSYDYDRSFSANAGGGFNCCGISFEASGSYTEHTHQHQIDQSGTTLTFADDPDTIRFIGYAVVKSPELSMTISPHIKRLRKSSRASTAKG